MRPLAMMLVMLTVTSLAAAQEPIAPAAPPNVGKGALLLPQAPGGWGYRVSDGPSIVEKRWGLFSAGIIMLSVGWCANLSAGIPTGEWRLDVPLLGPLLEIERLGSGDGIVAFIDLTLVTDAAVQIAGLAMMIAGGTTTHKRTQQRIQLVPLGAGAAIRGQF